MPLTQSFWLDEYQRMVKVFAPFALRALLSGGRSGLNRLPPGSPANWDEFGDNAAQFANEWVLGVLASVSATTQRQVVLAVSEWERQGRPDAWLEARLQVILSDDRAAMIAVTEITRLHAQGALMMWEVSGIVQAKVWRTAQDERVCPQCGPLEGQVVEFNAFGDFVVPFIGATIATPPAHPSCRCWLDAVLIPVPRRTPDLP